MKIKIVMTVTMFFVLACGWGGPHYAKNIAHNNKPEREVTMRVNIIPHPVYDVSSYLGAHRISCWLLPFEKYSVHGGGYGLVYVYNGRCGGLANVNPE